MLNFEEIEACFPNDAVYANGENIVITAKWASDFAHAVEAAVLAKVAGAGEPVAWLTEDGRIATDATKQIMPAASKENFNIPLYLHPPIVAAPSPAPADLHGAVRDAIADAIGGDAYDCIRVWSAWNHGTMGQDDFVSIVEDDARLDEIADAVMLSVHAANRAKRGEK